jgi:serine/threonine-protein kinase
VARGILWCTHCGSPHDLDTKVCPATGKSLERGIHKPQSPPKTHPLIGQTIAGRYKITRLLGAGGMGEVLEAENILLRRQVAIKVVRAERDGPEGIERLQREAQFVAAIQHPNICDVLDVGTLPSGQPYLVLERLYGETLAEHLKRTPQLAIGVAADLISQVLSGLHAAHGTGIVHRDLKPANIYLLDRLGLTPLVKLVDFGLAKDLTGSRATMTKPGKVVGTPSYMAPEQLAGEPLDRRCDVFAVGVILYEALTGRHPFRGASNADTTVAVLREEPTSMRLIRKQIPVSLEVVVGRALAKKRDRRWPTAFDFQRALVASVQG